MGLPVSNKKSKSDSIKIIDKNFNQADLCALLLLVQAERLELPPLRAPASQLSRCTAPHL